MSATQVRAADLPVLWQLEVSHYNEKARWALDYKRVPHLRRSLLPGIHVLAAKRLTDGGETTPILTLDGNSIGDSTRIIAAIEERWPDPLLYPSDPADRERALELEDYFDEELGAHIRRAVYHVLLDHPDIVLPLFLRGQRLPARVLVRSAWPLMKVGMRRGMSIYPDAAADSRERCVEVMDRLEAELQPSGYLVGDSFSVADLTAASLFYPAVQPAEFPYPSVRGVPDEAREFLNSLRARPGGQWVAEMYHRHRRPAT